MQKCRHRTRDRSGEGAAITGYGPSDPRLADAYAVEDEVLQYARRQSELATVRPVSPASGAALAVLTAAVGARSVVEIGTGAGVSGICLLRGMRPDGILTTVDIQPGLQRQARELFSDAGFAPSRARCIPGAALEVLPRLADGQYDLVFCDGDPAESPEYLAESLRLLRPGGMVCFEGTVSALEDVATRDLMRTVREHDALLSALLPVGDGLLCAVRR
ncbi:O-methyltransferase [Streptacidiphilus sp. EB103A]|uniref:O-methyltransferase n=1 Tax=Streptacidiphilus sp. EB103A TaxID=3156275 RepID=UPI003517C18F